MPKDVIFTDRLMRPIAHFSHAARSGSVVHIGAVAGVFPGLQLAGDSVGRIDVAAQVRRMFDNLEIELGLMGAALSDVVRIKTYLAFPRDVEKYRDVFRERFVEGALAHTVVGSWDFPLPQAAVELDAVAVISGAARSMEVDRISSGAGTAAMGGGLHYATALPANAAGNAAGWMIEDQLAATFKNLDRMLSSAGLKIDDVCNLHVTLADIRDRVCLEEGLQRFFSAKLPSLTIVGAPLERVEFRIAVESIACSGGGERLGSNIAPMMPGKAAPAVLANDTLFLSGQTGLAQGADTSGNVTVQTNMAWARLNELIATAGFAEDSMLRTNNVLTDWRDYAGFNSGYGANVREPYVPRATVLGQLSDARCRVQIEGIAHKGGSEATILQVPPKIAS